MMWSQETPDCLHGEVSSTVSVKREDVLYSCDKSELLPDNDVEGSGDHIVAKSSVYYIPAGAVSDIFSYARSNWI